MKKITFILLCITVLCMPSAPLWGQAKDPKAPSNEDRRPFDREDFMTKRNTYITEKIGLTAQEAAIFMPLDNELMQKKFEAGRDCHQMERELRKKPEKKKEDSEKLLKCREEAKEKREKLEKEYLEKFKKVLSAEKILKYQSADRTFFEEYMQDRKK